MHDLLFLFLILFVALLVGQLLPASWSPGHVAAEAFENRVPLLPAGYPQEQPQGSNNNNIVTPPFPPGDMDPAHWKSVGDNWFHEPVYALGSYAQVTNNVRYPSSPDNGSCTPPSFCGSFYAPGEVYMG